MGTKLPVFAECPVRKGGDECEKDIRRSCKDARCGSTGNFTGVYPGSSASRSFAEGRRSAEDGDFNIRISDDPHLHRL